LSQLQRSLDFIEKFGGSVESEISEFLDAVMASSILGEASSWFINFLGWWYRRTKAYQKFLNRIFSLPLGATIMRENTVSFILRTNDKEPPTVITVKYSAYDLVEMVTLNWILRDEESKKNLVDLLVESIKNAYVKALDGKVYTTREYVENVLKMDWNEFEKKLRGRIEADIEAYLHEMDKVEGSRLAKHIWLRQNSLAGGLSPWLFQFSQISTMSLLSLHTKVYVARNSSLLKYWFKDHRRAALKYYAYVGRFKTVVDTLMHESFHDAKAILEKGSGEKVVDALHKAFGHRAYDYKDIAEAVKHDFNELRDIFVRTTHSIPRTLLSADIIARFSDSRVSTDTIEAIGKSRMKAEDEENVSINS